MRSSYQEIKNCIAVDLSASYWLKNAIQALDKRDPVDALKDAEVLLEAQRARLRAHIGGY